MIERIPRKHRANTFRTRRIGKKVGQSATARAGSTRSGTVAVDGNRSRPPTTRHRAKTLILRGFLTVLDQPQPRTDGFESRWG
jgi:hypothetical protein